MIPPELAETEMCARKAWGVLGLRGTR